VSLQVDKLFGRRARAAAASSSSSRHLRSKIVGRDVPVGSIAAAVSTGEVAGGSAEGGKVDLGGGRNGLVCSGQMPDGP
jgi:hypothetical protein